MGYAAGVGKTYKMLQEAQEMKASGIDTVIGYLETHGRKDTLDQAEGLEVVPRKRIEYRGSNFEEMDTGAILARRPASVLVDEFAHTNIPGSERQKRWEDVELLLNQGIDVLTTMNVQHLESLNDQVWHVTGVRVRETVPDWVVETAQEVVMIDLTPRALIHRLERGVVYERGKAESAKQNFFRESTLVALRELALRQTAHEVQSRIWKVAEGQPAPESLEHPADRRHKILVLVTSQPEAAMVVRRAKRMSDFLHAECFAVAVNSSVNLDGMPQDERESLERHLNFARNLHIETRILEGEDVAQSLIDFGRRNQITQIYLARPRTRPRLPWMSRGLVQRIVGLAKDMQIVIVSGREPAEG
jgi:two-component system sensor histidine kinase KdpD